MENNKISQETPEGRTKQKDLYAEQPLIKTLSRKRGGYRL